jgi:hypothetical protein
MNDISEHLTTSESRAWLATQFVLGELNEEQTAQFDAAIRKDVALCDAVIEAARLVSGLMLAQEVVASKSVPQEVPRLAVVAPHRRGRLMAWTVVGSIVAAMTLAVISVQPESKFSKNSSFSSVLGSPATVADMETADVYVALLPEVGILEADDESDEVSADRDALNDLVAPEWLLTAVELEQQSAAESASDDADVF